MKLGIILYCCIWLKIGNSYKKNLAVHVVICFIVLVIHGSIIVIIFLSSVTYFPTSEIRLTFCFLGCRKSSASSHRLGRNFESG